MAYSPLKDGRDAYRRGRWADAYSRLSEASTVGSLSVEDLDLLGTAAYLTGRPDEAAEAWQHAFAGFFADHDVARGARCAFWLALTLIQRGEHAQASGWLARAQGSLDEAGLDGPEHGYLRAHGSLRALHAGEVGEARTGFDAVVATADRFDDADLGAIGRLGLGQALIAAGEVARGVTMLDEAMLAVATGEVSPIAVGLVYCGVITTCQQVFDVRRAQEWTTVLSRWCAGQQDLAPYQGQCLVHRSQVMQLCGDWSGALDEAHRACEHLADPPGDPVLGMAQYQLAELFRLRGQTERAEQAYRNASNLGHPAQPGLALLRLAQGRVDDAMATMRRLVRQAATRTERAGLLAAYVEVALAAEDRESARTACEELSALGAEFDSAYLCAVADSARGPVLLADGAAEDACAAFGRALTSWQELAAPFEAARVRVGLARAYMLLGDDDSAELELAAARGVFSELGAIPALDQVRQLDARQSHASHDGLSPRELEVLRWVATGATNREIATALVISEKTVARHVANLFAKIGVTSRAAATAYAYRHRLA